MKMRPSCEGIATQNLPSIDAMVKFCELCKTLRIKDAACEIHRWFIALPETCELCPTSC